MGKFSLNDDVIGSLISLPSCISIELALFNALLLYGLTPLEYLINVSNGKFKSAIFTQKQCCKEQREWA